MKKFIITLIGLFSLVAFTQAASPYTTNLSTLNKHLVSATPFIIDNLLVVGNTGTNGLLRLYDHQNTGLTNVALAYVSSYVTNVDNITTNITSAGVTNLWTNSVLQTVLVTNAAATNAVSPFAVYAIPSGVVTTIPYGNALTKGLVLSNDVTMTVIVNYRNY